MEWAEIHKEELIADRKLAKENKSPADRAAEIGRMAMYDLVEAKYIDGYLLELFFENGKKGTYDFSSYVKKGGVFGRFSDLAYFKKFFVNKELGVLCWPDGLDIAPETFYHKATGEPLPAWMTGEKPTLVKG